MLVMMAFCALRMPVALGRLEDLAASVCTRFALGSFAALLLLMTIFPQSGLMEERLPWDGRYDEVIATVARLPGTVVCPKDPTIPMYAKQHAGRGLFAEFDAHPVAGAWSRTVPETVVAEVRAADFVVDLRDYWDDRMGEQDLRGLGFVPADDLMPNASSYRLWRRGGRQGPRRSAHGLERGGRLLPTSCFPRVKQSSSRISGPIIGKADDMERRRTRQRTDSPPEPGRAPHRQGGSAGRFGASRDRSPDPREAIARYQATGPIVMLIPIFNDWESLTLLLPELDDALASHGFEADVLVVDDGSTTEPKGLSRIARSRRCGGSTSCGCGATWGTSARSPSAWPMSRTDLQSRAVVVMDGDGEDDPADVPRLLEHLEQDGRRPDRLRRADARSESLRFRIFYASTSSLHRLLTGQKVRVGNFSAIPRRRLSSLVVVTELWNHYAAGVIRSRATLLLRSRPTVRGRLSGRSTMNFVSLVTHGLSAISVYSDVVGVRLLVLSVLSACVAVGGSAPGDRAADDRVGHPGLGDFDGRHAHDSPGSGDHGGLRLQLRDPRRPARVAIPARRDYSFFVGSVWTLHDGPSVTPLPIPELADVVPW